MGTAIENEVNYLRPVITSLRKKLGTHLIKTEPAVGYRLQDFEHELARFASILIEQVT